MKNAEEWALEFHAPAHSAIYITNKIKSIQSDAHQSGVLEGLKKAICEVEEANSQGGALSRILSLAEQIKSQGVK